MMCKTKASEVRVPDAVRRQRKWLLSVPLGGPNLEFAKTTSRSVELTVKHDSITVATERQYLVAA